MHETNKNTALLPTENVELISYFMRNVLGTEKYKKWISFFFSKSRSVGRDYRDKKKIDRCGQSELIPTPLQSNGSTWEKCIKC